MAGTCPSGPGGKSRGEAGCDGETPGPYGEGYGDGTRDPASGGERAAFKGGQGGEKKVVIKRGTVNSEGFTRLRELNVLVFFAPAEYSSLGD
jgi:hypothetical protein